MARRARKKASLQIGNIALLVLIVLSLIAGVIFLNSRESTDDRSKAYSTAYPHFELVKGPTDGKTQVYDLYLDASGMKPDTIIHSLAATGYLTVTPTPVLGITSSPLPPYPTICIPQDSTSCPTGYECYQPPMPECPAGYACPLLMPAPYCRLNNTQICWNRVIIDSDGYYWSDGCRGQLTKQMCTQALEKLTDEELRQYRVWLQYKDLLPPACGQESPRPPSSASPTPTPLPVRILYQDGDVFTLMSDSYDIFEYSAIPPITKSGTAPNSNYVLNISAFIKNPTSAETLKRLQRIKFATIYYRAASTGIGIKAELTGQTIKGVLPGSTQEIELYQPNSLPSVSPMSTCMPRPRCLDENPRCLMPEPINGWCPSTEVTPTATPITPTPRVSMRPILRSSPRVSTMPAPSDFACADIYQPVCGVDNKTYSNECVAKKAGVQIRSTGECRTSTPRPSLCPKPPTCLDGNTIKIGADQNACPTYRCERPSPIPWYRFWFNYFFGRK